MAANRKVTLTLGLKMVGATAIRDAVRSVNSELKSQEKAVLKLRTAALPRNVRERARIEGQGQLAQLELNVALEKERAIQDDILGITQKRVRLQLQMEELTAKRTFVDQKERARQLGPVRAIADLFGLGKGGRVGSFLQSAGGTLAGVGKSIGGKAGGFLGSAGNLLGKFGPEIGIAVAGYAILAKVTKGLAAAPFKAVSGGMETVNKALGGLSSKLGPIDSAFNKLTGDLDSFANGPIKYVNPALAGVAEGVSSVLKQSQAFLSVSVDLAAKAQPGVIRRFNLALDDTAAVVGHRLVPVVELMTKAVRFVGDVLQTVLPPTQEFRSVLAPLGEIMDGARAAAAPLANVLRYGLTAGLKVLGATLQGLLATVRVVGHGINSVLGKFSPFKGGGLDSSVGAAARPVQFTTPEDYAKQVYTAAASSGADPAKRTADNTDAMRTLLEQIKEKLGGAGGEVQRNALDAAAGFARGMWLGFNPLAGLLGGK